MEDPSPGIPLLGSAYYRKKCSEIVEGTSLFDRKFKSYSVNNDLE